jgi:tRNA pseudouridine38-40 synthase
MRVRALVAYDGTNYSGYQRQANAPTVQAALEAALARVTGEEVTILAAGRTDAGVHAAGQTIAFDTAWRHGLDDLVRALNAVLPDDVSARSVEEAEPAFHPRYDARSRIYRYSLYLSSIRCPLVRRYSLHVASSLDRAAMQRGAQALVGEHDFAAFGRPPQGRSTVRRVISADWTGQLPGVHFTIEANAFLYRMVRSIVGTLLDVGRGKLSVDDFVRILQSQDRGRAGPTAPPHGLCLMEVIY